MPTDLSRRDIATVLAAQRAWQCALIRDDAPTDMDHFCDDATPLDADEIDDLCERINFGD